MDISVSEAPVGRLLDSRYRVESMLARGGMATVYRAVDTRLDRTVALKVMHAELAADDAFVSRFIGEARSAARLSDPHVVAVFDQGEDAGAVYLAMEYVPGRTLRDVLRERGRLEPDLALEVAESVLAALSAAHQADIVHRDVKPENVLVGNDGRVKVADFGLARALSSGPNTTTGLLMGTVNYISPEQALGEPATTRSDVYSAGIMLFELLTGSAPHVGPTDFVIVRRHIDEDVPAPSSVVPMPAAVDEIVQVATSRDPGARFADATRFLAAVRQTRTAIRADQGDDADEPADPGAEPRETAGVTLGEALGVALAPDAVADGDGPPPPPPGATAAAVPATPDEPSTRTRVIATGPSARSPRRDADARDRHEAAPGVASHGQRRNKRGLILFVAILLLAVGIAAAGWWFGAGRWTSAPSLLNLTPDAAQALAAEHDLKAAADGAAYSETVEAGLVLSTDPRPGEQLLRNGEITFVVSKGPERYEVPELVNLTLAAATEALEKVTLTVEPTEEFHDTVPAGTVVSQGVAPGESVKASTAVPVVVSKGPQPIEIADHTGRSVTEAEAALAEAGFKVTKSEQPSDTVAPGVVISQDPASGTGVRNQEIHLVVSSGPERLSVPNVVGRPLDEAKPALEGGGFVVNVVDLGLQMPDRGKARVIRQEPDGGTLPRGATVSIIIL